MIFLFLLSYILYYGIKGIIINDKIVKKFFIILTLSLFLLCYSISLNFSGVFEIILRVFMFISLVEYLLFYFDLKPFLFKNLYSIFYLHSKDIKVKYKFLKPFFMFLYNVVAIFKSEKFMGLKDKIVVEINTDDVSVLIEI